MPSGGYVPSLYQSAIFDWMRDGTGHGIVNAVAGSGKSTTLEQGVRGHIPERDPFTFDWTRILMMAFNKHIEVAMTARMPKYVDCRTFNSFGWRICRYNVPQVQLRANKNSMYFMGVVNPEGDRGRYGRLRQPVLKMVGLLKALNEHNIDRWQEHSKLYGVEMGDVKPSDRYEDVLREVFNWSINEIDIMDFDDQVFQVLYRGWELPPFSWVLLDEVQDASPSQIEMSLRLAEKGRLLMVGDPDQSIYLFRGAHPDAMGELTRSLGATELPLSVCYRCSDAIIECARQEVPRMEAPSPNPNGPGSVEWVTTEEFLREVRDGEMVLCRMTAPLIKRCLQMLNMGRKAYVKGRDLVDQVIMLVEQVHGDPQELESQVFQFKKFGRLPRNDTREFIDKLMAYKADHMKRLEAQGRDVEAQALEDRVEGLMNFAANARFVGEIIVKVEQITSDESQEGVAFMTGHKCKGLEAEKGQKVWLLRPDLCPHSRAKSAIQLRQERNLKYVMKTRGREDLRFVEKEKEEK